MYIHREGYIIILIFFLLLTGINIGLFYLLKQYMIIYGALFLASLVFFILVVGFFRIPHRDANIDETLVIAPSDGKIVIIEEVEEPEYFKDKRIQVSIFMSPLNVHAQWSPISGLLKYYKYHPGKYLVAWHPKSSLLNERTTIVLQHDNGTDVMFRQIAGAVARRICFYKKEGEYVEQAGECGFIKFGSRIDLFLPLDSKIKVKIGDKVSGKITPIAQLF